MKQPCLLSLLALGLAATGCKKEAATPAGAVPVFAVQAVVVEAKVQPVNETLSLVGSVAANEMVEIKSETDGTLEEVLFTEGQRVKQGDLLIRLDESKFSASVNEAEANFKLSETTYERSKQLQRDKLVSQQEFDQAAAQYQANMPGFNSAFGFWTRALTCAVRVEDSTNGAMKKTSPANVRPGYAATVISIFCPI